MFAQTADWKSGSFYSFADGGLNNGRMVVQKRRWQTAFSCPVSPKQGPLSRLPGNLHSPLFMEPCDGSTRRDHSALNRFFHVMSSPFLRSLPTHSFSLSFSAGKQPRGFFCGRRRPCGHPAGCESDGWRETHQKHSRLFSTHSSTTQGPLWILREPFQHFLQCHIEFSDLT